MLAALDGDPARPDRAGLTRRLTDPDGTFGMPGEAVDTVVVGGPASLSDQIGAVHAAGADRVIVSVAGGDWFRQTELVAKAATLL